MSVIETATALLTKIPASAITFLITIIEQAISSGNPKRYLERVAAAQAAQAAAKKVAGEALETKAKPVAKKLTKKAN